MSMSRTWNFAKARTASPTGGRRRLAPMIEAVEERQLLSTAAGFLAGTVTLDGAGTPVAGATIELFAPNKSNPVATTTTGANGQYLLTGLAPGNYTLKEIPPSGYSPTAAQALSQLNPASVAGADTINVTVADPSKVFVNYGAIIPGSSAVVNDVVKGKAQVNSVGPMHDTLGTAPGKTDLNAGYQTFCVNDLQSLSYGGGESYQVIPKPITALTDGTSTISADHAGRIAYLFNHYGNSTLSNVQGAGLQLAMWELLYDNGNTPDFNAGGFQVTGPYAPTTQAQLDQVIAQAKAYFNESSGKSETAVFLDAAAANGCKTVGLQGVLATGSFNFTVSTTDCGCDCHDLKSVSYTINGCRTVTDLRGNVHPGDTVVAKFTVPKGETDTLSLVSYTAPQSYFDANTASQQKVYCYDTETFGPGCHTLTVKVPCGNFQVDFVCGSIIRQLGPAGSNNFYTPQGRLLSADNGGPTVCGPTDSGQGKGGGSCDTHSGGSSCGGSYNQSCDTGRSTCDDDSHRGSTCDTDRQDCDRGGSTCDTGGSTCDTGRTVYDTDPSPCGGLLGKLIQILVSCGATRSYC